MDAKNYRLQQLFSGTQQFVVPIYQREYSWEKRDWQALWDDIAEVYEDSGEELHFLGSIVSKPYVSAAGGISSFVVIDGQQRMTTLTLLLAALRDAFASAAGGLSQRSDKIQNLYLTNQYGDGQERYKVVPTRSDQDSYFAVIDRKISADIESHRVIEAYRFFGKAIRTNDSNGKIFDLDRLEQIILGGLEVVSITLGPDDNDYRVFESLNARGRPLSQTDLLRNYFLMRFERDRQEEVYADYFLPMTRALADTPKAESDAMFQQALQRQGVYVRDRDIYFQWKRRCDPLSIDALFATIDEISYDCSNYLKILDPNRESSAVIRNGLQRLLRFGILTPMPFLLNVYRWYGGNMIDQTGMATILQYIESFLVRRLFSGVSIGALNRIFIRLADQFKSNIDLVAGTRDALSQPGLRWPSDSDFVRGLYLHHLYKDSRPEQRKMVLETLENSFGHLETPSFQNATIEHILPQTLSAEWRRQLGDQAEQTHSRFVHTLGNLTLTGYNSHLSNSPFETKRQLLSQSNFALNKEVATAEVWNAQAIASRAQQLANRALKIWIGPIGGEQPAVPEFSDVINEDPGDQFPDLLEKSLPEIQDLFDDTKEYLLAIAPNVIEKRVKYWWNYWNTRIFVSVVPQKKRLVLTLKLNPNSVQFVEGFVRDISQLGHAGNGDVEVSIASLVDLIRAKPLIERSFKEN